MPFVRTTLLRLRGRGRWKWTGLDLLAATTYAAWVLLNAYVIPRVYGVDTLTPLWQAATLTEPADPVFPFFWVLTLAIVGIAWTLFRPLGDLRAFFLAGTMYPLLEEIAETPAFLLAAALHPGLDGWWARPAMLVMYASYTLLGLTTFPLWRPTRWSWISGAAIVGVLLAWVAIGLPANIAQTIGSEVVQPTNFVIEVGLKLMAFLVLVSLVLETGIERTEGGWSVFRTPSTGSTKLSRGPSRCVRRAREPGRA